MRSRNYKDYKDYKNTEDGSKRKYWALKQINNHLVSYLVKGNAIIYIY